MGSRPRMTVNRTSCFKINNSVDLAIGNLLFFSLPTVEKLLYHCKCKLDFRKLIVIKNLF
jgi:hypothetical protein